VDKSEFMRVETKEVTGHDTHMCHNRVRQIADHIIMNDAGLEELHKEIDALLQH